MEQSIIGYEVPLPHDIIKIMICFQGITKHNFYNSNNASS